MYKLLVTGSAGFVGSHLCRVLLQAGHQVVGIDNINSYYDTKLKYSRIKLCHDAAKASTGSFSFRELDLCSYDELYSIFEQEQFDQVYHLAAQAGVRYSIEKPLEYIHSNLDAFSKVMECCRQFKIQHFIYASSSSIYGMNERVPFSEQHPANHPVSLYAATKRSNELLAHSYSHLYRLPSTGLRFFTVYGPWGRPDMAYFSFTRKIFAGETIQVYNHGKMMRDFTYIDDIVESLVRLLEYRPEVVENPNNLPDRSALAPFRIFNIGNHQPVELIEFIRLLEKVIGKKAVLEMQGMQAGDVFQTYAEISSLNEAVQFKPSTPFETGLERFVKWYREYYKPA